MKYSESLKKSRDFKKVYDEGKSKANRYLVMYVRKNNLGINRIGISASKKYGNSVKRHRFCRLVREGYRHLEEYFHIGYDCVFIARVNSKDCTYHEIEGAIYQLAQIHGILRKNEDENCFS